MTWPRRRFPTVAARRAAHRGSAPPGPTTVGRALVDCRAEVFDGRHGFIQAAAAACQRLGGQVEKVRAANPGGRGPCKLPREQIREGGKLPLRRPALLGIGQGGNRIDEEYVPRLVSPFQTVPPIIADIGVLLGMGLHEDQPCPRRGRGKFLGHPCAAVLLLRGGHDQDVAQRQDPPQSGQRRVRRQRAGGVGRIGIGAIDQDQVRQRRQILLDQFDFVGIHAQDVGRQSRAAEQYRASRRRTAAAGADQFGPRQGVDQRAFPGSGSTQGGHDERRFQADAEAAEPARQAADNRLTGLGRPPWRGGM